MGLQSMPQAVCVPYHMDQFALFHLWGAKGGRDSREF